MKRSTRPCSILEASLWTVSYPLAQTIVLVLFSFTLLITCFGWSWPPLHEVTEFALEMNLDRSFLLVGVSSLGALFLILPLVRFRLGGGFREQLGYRLPRHEEVIFALAMVVPIAVLGDLLHEILRQTQTANFTQPFFSNSVSSSTLSYLRLTSKGVSYPILVVALALGPAIGEEVIFRGIIGRGLVQRYGSWIGSLITAGLFAVAHMTPTHAIATIPIALLLQFLYLKTGTIWIPILVHFCNNMLGVTMMRFDLAMDIPVSPLIAIGFLTYLATLMLTFETRRRHWTTT